MKITFILAFVSLLAAAIFAQRRPALLLGGDVSEIPEVEAAGGTFLAHGKKADPFELMRQAGWNFVRFRVWNHPTAGFCDKEHTLALAKRADAAGMQISIDLHYSDWWADPGKQTKPAAWRDFSFEDLTRAVREFTRDIVSSLVRQGTPPVMVQIGNEITGGMLWPDGRVQSDDPESWHRLGVLLKAGIQGAHEGSGGKKILTMIHLDRGADNGGATWWFDHIVKEHVDFDLIGLSYYPFWHGPMSALKSNLNALADRFSKDLYVVETGYPWTVDLTGRHGGRVFADKSKLLDSYPPSPEGQAAFLKDLIGVVAQVHGHRGKGLLYWAPTWISAPKKPSPYDNLALFDYEGNALPGFWAMGGGHGSGNRK